MKGAKGKSDMAEAIGTIQQLILKPEWKDLVQDVLENEQLTERTQESVVAVANAIVTPLSLLVYAAELPQERIEECRTLWKETLKHLGNENQDQNESEMDEPQTKLDNQDVQVDDPEQENVNEMAPSTAGPKRKLSFGTVDMNQLEEIGMDEAFVGDEPETDQQEQPAGITRPFPEPIPPFPEDENEKEHESPKAHQILAKQAAKKGLVMEKSFHERTRSKGEKVNRKTTFE